MFGTLCVPQLLI